MNFATTTRKSREKPNQNRAEPKSQWFSICYLYIILVIKTKSIVTYILDFFNNFTSTFCCDGSKKWRGKIWFGWELANIFYIYIVSSFFSVCSIYFGLSWEKKRKKLYIFRFIVSSIVFSSRGVKFHFFSSTSFLFAI